MIQIPLEIGDTILAGRFKNKKITVREISYDEYGNPTVNGRSILKIRIPKLYQMQENSMKLRENKKLMFVRSKNIPHIIKEYGLTFDEIYDYEQSLINKSVSELRKLQSIVRQQQDKFRAISNPTLQQIKANKQLEFRDMMLMAAIDYVAFEKPKNKLPPDTKTSKIQQYENNMNSRNVYVEERNGKYFVISEIDKIPVINKYGYNTEQLAIASATFKGFNLVEITSSLLKLKEETVPVLYKVEFNPQLKQDPIFVRMTDPQRNAAKNYKPVKQIGGYGDGFGKGAKIPGNEKNIKELDYKSFLKLVKSLKESLIKETSDRLSKQTSVKIKKSDGRWHIYADTIDGEECISPQGYETKEQAEHAAMMKGYSFKGNPYNSEFEGSEPLKPTKSEPIKHEKPKDMDLGKEKELKLENLIRKIIRETNSWGDYGYDRIKFMIANSIFDRRYKGISISELMRLYKKIDPNITESQILQKIKELGSDYVNVGNRWFYKAFAPKNENFSKEKEIKLESMSRHTIRETINREEYLRAIKSIIDAFKSGIIDRYSYTEIQNDIHDMERSVDEKNYLQMLNKTLQDYGYKLHKKDNKWEVLSESNKKKVKLKEDVDKKQIRKQIEDYIQQNWNKKPYNGQIRFKGDLLIIDNAEIDFGDYASSIASAATGKKWSQVTASIAKLNEFVSNKKKVKLREVFIDDPELESKIEEMATLHDEIDRIKARLEELTKRYDPLNKELTKIMEQYDALGEKAIETKNILITIKKRGNPSVEVAAYKERFLQLYDKVNGKMKKQADEWWEKERKFKSIPSLLAVQKKNKNEGFLREENWLSKIKNWFLKTYNSLFTVNKDIDNDLLQMKMIVNKIDRR